MVVLYFKLDGKLYCKILSIYIAMSSVNESNGS